MNRNSNRPGDTTLQSGAAAMTDLEDIRSLIEVIECGGFNRAAIRLGVSKSIVSRRIARLEAELGTRLLSRTTRGISPTEAGLELKMRGERILKELDEARQAVACQTGAVTGSLRLSVPLSFGVRHVAPVLAELARRHPQLELDVSYSDRLVDVIADRLDAVIRISTLPDSSLVARRIAPIRSVLVASPAYLEAHGTPQHPADLSGHECLIYSGRTQPDWRFSAGKKTISFRPQGRLHSDSGEAIRQWAIAGLGIAQSPAFLVADSFPARELVPLLTDYSQPAAELYVLRPPGAHVAAKVRALIDIMVEFFGKEPFWDACLMAGHGRADGAVEVPDEAA
jgi:DNA-binding transcriptional LysR family regulator